VSWHKPSTTFKPKAFIDETRVLESVLNHRAPKLGNGRIKQELQAKGLAPAAVAAGHAGVKRF
jgi:regulatory protein